MPDGSCHTVRTSAFISPQPAVAISHLFVAEQNKPNEIKFSDVSLLCEFPEQTKSNQVLKADEIRPAFRVVPYLTQQLC